MSSETVGQDNEFSLPLEVPIRYTTLLSPEDRAARAPQIKETIFLLHGYAERKERILRILAPRLLRPGVRLIAINGPFPVPVLKEGEFKEAYAWYFYWPKKEVTLIGPEVNKKVFEAILARENIGVQPTRIVGYSQGGFLIPFLAPLLPGLKQAVGIGTGFRPERYPDRLPYRIDAIHGSADEIMSCANAEEGFKKLRNQASHGEFTIVPGGGHLLDEAKGDALYKVIQSVSTVA